MSPEKSIGRVLARATLPFLMAIATLSGVSCEINTQTATPAILENRLRDVLQRGDVALIGERAFLLKEGRSYPILDLDKYKKGTKLEQYGRKILLSDKNLLTQYPPLTLPNRAGDLGIIDPFTGTFKNAQPFGGEINIFFGGFLTDEGAVYDSIVPGRDTFVTIRKTLKEEKHWQDLGDSFFFTYGEKGLDHYPAKNTARPPQENITKALEYFETLQELLPLTQFNLIGHSLGGVFALEVAKKYPDAVNNLVLINSPVRGIEQTLDRTFKVQTIRQFLKPIVGEEQTTSFLFERWGDKKYQEDLDKFATAFTKSGRKLLVITSSDDPIVPTESSKLPGATEMTISVGSFPLLESLKAHGRPLKDGKVTTFLADNFGEKIIG